MPSIITYTNDKSEFYILPYHNPYILHPDPSSPVRKSLWSPADRKQEYYVSKCTKSGYKHARMRADYNLPVNTIQYRGCRDEKWSLGFTKEQIDKFPRYLRHGFEYGAESDGFKFRGDTNRKKFWSGVYKIW
jgi:hypothetical protein